MKIEILYLTSKKYAHVVMNGVVHKHDNIEHATVKEAVASFIESGFDVTCEVMP